MLARSNRLLTAADFRGVLRRGKRHSMVLMTVSTVATGEGMPARFGFIVTKKVGNAVKRNLVRRRFKAAARKLVDGGVEGMDVVARAHPEAIDASWEALKQELSLSVKGVMLR